MTRDQAGPAGTGQGVLSIRLIGTVSLQAGTEPQQILSGTQAQLAFARLTLERHHHTSRDQLADTIWPNGLPSTWGSALRSIVSRVRSFVTPVLDAADCALVALNGQYILRLPIGVTVDVDVAMESSRAALAELAAGRPDEALSSAEVAVGILRGPFIPDHDSEWLTATRERLDEVLVTCLESAARAAALLGRTELALAYADEAIARQPLRESAHRCRMRVQLAAGNPADALRGYQRLRRSLAMELGVNPSPDTEELHLQLLSPVTAQPSGTKGCARPMPFLGRHEHLGAIAAAWEQAQAGRAQAVLVSGEAGIGKSRLMIEAARPIAKAGHFVLRADCHGATARPFQPIVEAIGSYLASTPDDVLPPFNAATRSTLDELLEQPVHGRRLHADATKVLMTLIEAIRALSANRPLLLIVDDIDRADDHTLTFLRYAGRRCNDCRLLIVMGSSGAPVQKEVYFAVVNGLRLGGTLVEVELGRLDEHHVRSLIDEVHAASDTENPPWTHDVMAFTGGNPFLVNEVIRSEPSALGTDIAMQPAIVAYAQRQMSSLDDRDAVFVRLAAAAGERFRLDVLAEAAGLSLDAARTTCARLIRAGLIACVPPGASAAPDELRFSHGVVRRTIDGIEEEPRRRDHRQRLAYALASRHAHATRAGVLTSHYRAGFHHRVAAHSPEGSTSEVPGSMASHVAEDASSLHAVRLHRGAIWEAPRAELLSTSARDAEVNLLDRGHSDLAASATLEDDAIDDLLRRGTAA